jgi:hypothetical protein
MKTADFNDLGEPAVYEIFPGDLEMDHRGSDHLSGLAFNRQSLQPTSRCGVGQRGS